MSVQLAPQHTEAVRQECELPLLARVPLLQAVPFALASVEGGADAVVAAPPRGLAAPDDPSSAWPVQVHGPLFHPSHS